MSTREQNERKFGNWKKLAHGGRVYWMDVAGHHGWTARYVKEVDADERTIRFHQEIRNAESEVVESHQKYPVDRGHRRLRERP